MNFLRNIIDKLNFAGSSETAYISLGSNLPTDYGPPEQTIKQAVECLKDLCQGQLSCSSIWHSEPENCPEGSPDFANAMVGMTLHSDESPALLLEKLKELESRFGRERSAVSNQPRTLDLDLIAYGNRQIDQENLTVPHPRAFSRAFVLFPMEEIAPDLVPPGQTRSVSELAAQLRLRGDHVTTIVADSESAGD